MITFRAKTALCQLEEELDKLENENRILSERRPSAVLLKLYRVCLEVRLDLERNIEDGELELDDQHPLYDSFHNLDHAIMEVESCHKTDLAASTTRS